MNVWQIGDSTGLLIRSTHKFHAILHSDYPFMISREIDQWIKNNKIDALKSPSNSAWSFKHSSDRMTLLLTWG